jgi:hypothetical protein
VVKFFEAVRRRARWELQEEVRKRGPRWAAANLLPPWGQFQNGHRTKAYWLLGGELTFGVTSIATAATLWAKRGETHEFTGFRSEAEALTVVNYVSFGITAALVVYGIADGLYYYYQGPTPEPAPPAPNPVVRAPARSAL